MAEKQARGALKSAVEHAVTRSRVVIFDSLNNIKVRAVFTLVGGQRLARHPLAVSPSVAPFPPSHTAPVLHVYVQPK